MSNKRYIFFDLDGTLLAGGYGKAYVPDSAKLALKKLKEAGHFLSIATGRSHAMAVAYMNELGFEHMVSDGGYGITLNGKLVGITPLEKNSVLALINECIEKNIPWALQADNSDTRISPDSRFQEFTNDTYMKTKVVENLRAEDIQNIYKAYIACNEPAEKSLKTLEGLPWGRFHKDYLFVEPFDKASGIRAMLKYFNADAKDVIVFGDSSNDFSMFC
ncbi:MAG: HAD-IIB family hydrolase, partial [Treponema sp.]|nr:HAD-IIB family hydrolase [Treponema sp.]